MFLDFIYFHKIIYNIMNVMQEQFQTWSDNKVLSYHIIWTLVGGDPLEFLLRAPTDSRIATG